MQKTGLSRRSFLALSGAVGASALMFGGCAPKGEQEAKKGDSASSADDGTQVVNTCSTFDCGGKCLIKAHMKDGAIARIDTRGVYEDDEANPCLKACVRGRSYRKWQYHPDRLQHPMKRVGKRGENKFEQISWDEAIEFIVSENERLLKEYGPLTRYINIGTGDTGGTIVRANLAARFCDATGGHVGNYNSVSMGNTGTATPYMFGVASSGSSLPSLKDTKLVILWGHNPAETIFGLSNYYFRQMKEYGCKFIVIDPRNSNTAIELADEWIPILPTTDNALMDAMAYVIVTEGLHDQKFLDTFVVGFDEEHLPEGVEANQSYQAYLTGAADGVEKTPEWAEPICKVPADTIRRIAREYATTKPAALIEGWGPQRHVCGERTALGGGMLACLTGNVGVEGGWAGAYNGFTRKSPVGMAPLPDSVDFKTVSVPMSSGWIDAIDDYTTMTKETGLTGADKLEYPVKMLWNIASDFMMASNPDINRVRAILEDESKVECIITSDVLMTPTAQWSDIVLPACTCFERWNVGATWNNGDYFILSQKLCEPLGEARSEYDWLAECADRMGVKDVFTGGKTEEEWVRYIVEETAKKYPEDDLPDFDTMLREGVAYFKKEEPRVAFQKQIEDPKNNPFETDSGKIELFSKKLYDMKNPDIPATPHYVPVAEGPGGELAAAYPLQLIGWKTKARDNSSYFTHPWLVQTQDTELWINPIDAEARGIADGDEVKVLNDRGAMKIPAKVTTRIVPGCVAAPTGSWYSPDAEGVDQNGCVNVLTSSARTSMTHGNTQHTNLVEVAKL